MPERIVVIHPLSVKRGHVSAIQKMITQQNHRIVAVDEYPLCLSSLRALTRSQSGTDTFEEYINSFARENSVVMLLHTDDDDKLMSVLGNTPLTYSPTTVRGKFRGENWLSSAKSYDKVFTTFDPTYNQMIFSMMFPASRGWPSLNTFIHQ